MPQPILDHWQYRIAESGEASDSAGLDVGGGFRLDVGPGLPVASVKAGGDAAAPLGYLLGFPIDLGGAGLVSDAWHAPNGSASGPDIVRALGGRFLYVERGARGPRLYPDAMAQVPCVFDPETRVAGCSAHALLDDDAYEARLDRPLIEAVGLIGEGWLPGMLTAHAGLRRLLSGHSLDLATGTVERIWPGPGAIPDLSPDDIVEEIMALVRVQLLALVEGPRRVALALTAGLDSRMILAIARDLVPRIDCVTVVAGDRHAVDTVLARRIARDLGLSHVELPRRVATKAEQASFLRRGGHCNGDSNRLYHPSIRPLSEGHVFVGGLAAEVGRAFLWRPEDDGSTRLTASELARRLGLPQVPRLLDVLQTRLDALPDLDGLRRLDLLYLEERMSCWSSVQFPCDPVLVRHAPLSTVRGLELLMALPPDWKRERRLGKEIIRRAWPELDRYPVNTLGPGRDALVKIQRILRDPSLIARKLRKLRA